MTEKDLIIQRLRREVDELEDELDDYKRFEEFIKNNFEEAYAEMYEAFAKEDGKNDIVRRL